MRLLTFIFLTTGFSGLALAHELPGDGSHLQQLAHQVLSLHHAPALVLLLVGVAIWYLRAGPNRSSTGKFVKR
jgi:hypothetical protein